ncbi:MAG TPA: GFA family protein [Caulobacteraceae bacterium]|jgi:hypothetical protein
MLKGSCHCGAQRFEVDAAPSLVTECNCSTCTKRGTVAAFYPAEDVRLQVSEDRLTAYQCGDRLMTFFHCATCGCAVYADSPSWDGETLDHDRRRITLNARLFDDFDLAAVPVRRVDGKNGW